MKYSSSKICKFNYLINNSYTIFLTFNLLKLMFNDCKFFIAALHKHNCPCFRHSGGPRSRVSWRGTSTRLTSWRPCARTWSAPSRRLRALCVSTLSVSITGMQFSGHFFFTEVYDNFFTPSLRNK